FANGDFGGVSIVSTITPNLRLLFTYVQIEEQLSGKKDIVSITTTAGSIVPQSRGDDLAFIISAEVTPMRGLDLKPMFSYIYINGITAAAARPLRGGYSNGNGGPFAPATVSGNDGGTGGSGGVGTGVGENRYTIGLDARFRSGPFSLDPTVMYQFGNR